MQDASGKMPGASDICAGDSGESLRVDGEPTEAEEEGCEGEVRGVRGHAAHGGDASAQLQKTGQKRRAPTHFRSKTHGNRPGQRGKHTRAAQQGTEHREEDDIAAEVQRDRSRGGDARGEDVCPDRGGERAANRARC